MQEDTDSSVLRSLLLHDHGGQQESPHQLSLPLISSPRHRSDGGHGAHPQCWQDVEDHQLPRVVHRHVQEDLAAASDVPGEHGVWSGGNSEPESAHDDCAQEVQHPHDHDR